MRARLCGRQGRARQGRGLTAEDAEVVVRGLNAHDDLLAALRGMLEVFDIWDDEEEDEVGGSEGSRAAAKARNRCVRAYAAGKAALAKAGE